MNTEAWQPQTIIDHFFFDFDGTLTSLEGIDVLAQMNGVAEKVQEITRWCMEQTGLTLEDYRARLVYTQPTKAQIQLLAAEYLKAQNPGAEAVVKLLLRLNKKVYILSGGIRESILPFATRVGIPLAQVLAVDVYFDEHGSYRGFDEQSYLAQAKGKAQAILDLAPASANSLLIGDGMSDWEARAAVTRFIGYGGKHPKAWIKAHAPFFINGEELYSLLPLGLTQAESTQLTGAEAVHYDLGLAAIKNKVVLIQES